MRTRPKLSWSDLRGAKVGVWGLGVEGHANVRRLEALGVTPVLVDDAPAAVPGAYRTAEGGLEMLAACDVVVKTPGISRYRAQAQALEDAGVALVGGLGLWLEGADRSRVACITGTKGKSTTTSIAGHLANRLGYRCFSGGNLGRPPWDPEADADYEYWLIETSSFQATDLASAPRVVAVTSLHPDHLNWHGDVERYYADKLSICTLPGEHVTVANAEDAVVQAHRGQLGEHVHWVPDVELPRDWVADLDLIGHHNETNALMAQAILAELGLSQMRDPLMLAAAAAEFVPLTSRLQAIGRVAGRTFVDDSLSTNVLPTLAALSAFTEQRVALIVGGFDREIDYAPLAIGLRARRMPLLVLAIPDSGQRIAQTLVAVGAGDAVEIRLADGLQEATRAGFEWAGPEGVVLLSPAAPSFGHFRDYRERSAAFAAAMNACAAQASES